MGEYASIMNFYRLKFVYLKFLLYLCSVKGKKYGTVSVHKDIHIGDDAY